MHPDGRGRELRNGVLRAPWCFRPAKRRGEARQNRLGNQEREGRAGARGGGRRGMTGEVTILEKALVPLRAQFGEALAGLDLTPERLMRSVLTAYEGSKRLQECPLADVINAAMTGAYCGLIVDGLTGQAAIIPF